MPMARPRSRGSKTLVMIDSVEGMTAAPPMPISARVAMRMPGEPAQADAAEPMPNTSMPAASMRLAAEPVAQHAEGEQQAGEGQRVRVDHPLLLALRRVQVLLDRGQGDVEDRVVEDHDQQRQARARRAPTTVCG